MTFWQAIQGVVRHLWGRPTFASFDGRDLHNLALSQWEVEVATAKWLWRD
jgi:hypothetical protein